MISKYPIDRDQADEWARQSTHRAALLAADLVRELEMVPDDRAQALAARVWELHGESFNAGRYTGLPEPCPGVGREAHGDSTL